MGIEDNVWLDEARSRLCTNIDQVSRINELGKLMGRRAMPPAKFKQLLELS
ncbi:MAG: 3-keto-5-aminohexanoate cleavage protein [Deltaproteobacteria bacterium]|nr:3-keto-5-aminohexanoate cleavage protein [Deltaproteobacteria bacterium]